MSGYTACVRIEYELKVNDCIFMKYNTDMDKSLSFLISIFMTPLIYRIYKGIHVTLCLKYDWKYTSLIIHSFILLITYLASSTGISNAWLYRKHASKQKRLTLTFITLPHYCPHTLIYAGYIFCLTTVIHFFRGL